MCCPCMHGMYSDFKSTTNGHTHTHIYIHTFDVFASTFFEKEILNFFEMKEFVLSMILVLSSKLHEKEF